MARPVVDLPQPDSPTRPSVSPRLMENDTPSTARTAPTLRWKMMPWVSGKCITRSRTSSSVSSPVVAGVVEGWVATATLWFFLARSGESGRLWRWHGQRLVGGAPLTTWEPAGGAVIVLADDVQRRHLGAALVSGVDTAGMEGTHVRQLDQVGRQPFDRDQALLPHFVEAGHAAQQPHGV